MVVKSGSIIVHLIPCFGNSYVVSYVFSFLRLLFTLTMELGLKRIYELYQILVVS